MTTDTIRGPAVRRASRFNRRLALLGLLIGAAAIIATTVGIGFAGPLGDVLARGELPTELLLIGAGGGLVVGLAITLIVGTVRGRRRRQPPNADDQADVPVGADPSAMPWPSEDAVSRAAGAPASRPTAALEAPQSISTWFETQRTSYPAQREVEEPGVQDVQIRHAAYEVPPAVNVGAERSGLSRSRTPLVAALGTVASGAAFAFGAVVGAGVGMTVAAAIGIAFALGAGAAVAATILLLRSQRQ